MSNKIKKMQKDIKGKGGSMSKDLQEELIKLEKEAEESCIQIVSEGLTNICLQTGVLMLEEKAKFMKYMEINEQIAQYAMDLRGFVEKIKAPYLGFKIIETDHEVVKGLVSELEGIDDSIHCSDDLKKEMALMFNHLYGNWMAYLLKKKYLLGEIASPDVEAVVDPVKKTIIFKIPN